MTPQPTLAESFSAALVSTDEVWKVRYESNTPILPDCSDHAVIVDFSHHATELSPKEQSELTDVALDRIAKLLGTLPANYQDAILEQFTYPSKSQSIRVRMAANAMDQSTAAAQTKKGAGPRL
jgi:hypothetical protein